MKTDNKRIAKNTMYLYFRMLLSMAITLYTSRVVLSILGVEDFGLYNVVGGILSLLSVLKVLVSSGTQRFLNYEMGKGASPEVLTEIFTSSLTLFAFVGALILLLAETFGLWFLNTYLVIPDDRLFAANVVFQVTTISMFVSMVQIPYTSAIMAHERMDIYGYIGVGEPLVRLGLILLMPFLPGDMLIIYSFILLSIFIGVTLFYIFFCKKNFVECRLKLSKNWAMCKSLVGFTIWNLLETISNSLSGQGQNILLNMFFGPTVNAARAVAYQVNHAVQGFASNFLIATFPQITKCYSSGDYSGYYSLMIRSSKFAFIVMSIIFIPICLNTEYILYLWLKTPPENSALYVNLVIVGMIIRMFSEPLYTGIQATGDIKKYQIVTNVVTLMNLPLCYMLLKIWQEPSIVFYVTIGLSFFFVVSRIYFIKKQAGFPVRSFVQMILIKCIIPAAIVYLPLYYINSLTVKNLYSFTGICVLSVAWSCSIFSFMSMNKNERLFVRKHIFKK